MAVYTEVSEADLAAFLGGYDEGSLVQMAPIAEGVENTNYFVETTRRRFVLTLFEKRVDKNDLPFFMTLKAHLAERGLQVPAPIENNIGAVIGQLSGRPAVLVEFLDGRPEMRPAPPACAELGGILGRLHLAVEDLGENRANALSLEGWQSLAGKCKDADRIDNGLSEKISDELSFLEYAWPKKLPSGVVHADLFPDNVLFENGKISGLIDFYFACTDFFAYDLAICINAWCFEQQGEFLVKNASALIRAYTEVSPLNGDEQTALPTLLRGAAMRFLLTRAYDWLNQELGAIVTVKDPLDYERILTFHQQNNGEFLRKILADQ